MSLNRIYQNRDLERVCRNTAQLLDEKLARIGVFFRVFSRIKESDSTIRKIHGKGEGYYDGKSKFLRDVIGIRVVLYFSDDIILVKKYLKGLFEFIEETIDENDVTEFAPTRVNLIFRLPKDLIQEFEDVTNDKRLDSTFEVQIRTILSEGWHEIEHDLRYKCSDDWIKNTDLSRNLNGILATLETSEYSILRLFEQLSYRHYKEKNISATIRTKFRLRFISDTFSDSLTDKLTDQFLREVFKLDRLEVIEYMCQSNFVFPISMENLIYIINYYSVKNESILEITPDLILEELKNDVRV